MAATLKAIVTHADKLLRTADITDYDGAVNGLQVENSGRVTRIAAAVDASLTTVRLAIEARAELLLVHHGLFWSKRQPWTGVNHKLMRLLIENDLAVYSSHLPLDFHPKLGNNTLLCAHLGLKNLRPFLHSRGQAIGLRSATALSRDELARRFTKAVGAEIRVIPAGPAICKKIGVVTGGAGDYLSSAAAEGVDTFVTGEGPHWTFAMAEELGVNLLYGGHYATETFGVKALAAEISRRFRVPWVYLDHPTGL